jgi:predicted aminopeptidase
MGLLLVLSLPWPLAGCQTIAYYAHVTRGQIEVLTSRTPVPRLMARLDASRDSDSAAARLYQRLDYTQQVLAFAEEDLGLRVGRRYRTFVDLDRPAVIWNVVAAPALSLEAHQWCYPLVGCAPYRGFFDHALAERQADRLRRRGYDTYVGPVTAYSTLGWFADPLLSTFIHLPEADLVELLLHELAHGEVWVPGDVAFNESFATFVGRQGAIEWGVTPTTDAGERRRLLELLAQTRDALQRVYQSPLDEAARLDGKAAVLGAAVRCHDAHFELLGRGRYRPLVASLDNARLAAFSTYEDLVPAFATLFREVGGRWDGFFDAVGTLAAADAATRAERLRRYLEAGVSGQQQVASGGDDHRADEVQCEPFFGHLLDGEAPRGVDDDVGRGGYREHEGA